jgi:microcystin degradation protein MlrC
MGRQSIRIAVLKFAHDTVTFLKPDTTIDDFTYPGSPARGEALLGSEPDSYIGLEPEEFDVIAIKSCVHFRRGFDDSGFAKTTLLLEPDEPFLGTVRLDGLAYENVDLTQFYPYGEPVFP